jgi:hypothetical protein
MYEVQSCCLCWVIWLVSHWFYTLVSYVQRWSCHDGHYKSSSIYFDQEIEMSCHRQQIALVGATSIDIVIVMVNMAIMEAHEARL